MRKLVLATALIGLGAAARSEIITLKDGTRIEGTIEGEMDGMELIRTKYGSLSINKSDILDIGAPEIVVNETFNSRSPAASTAPAGLPAEAAAVPLSTQSAARIKFTFTTVKPDTATALTIYYEDSVVIATEIFSSAGVLTGLKGTVKDGLYAEYYGDGALKTIKTMANGKTDGTFKAFFSDGIIQTEAKYSHGVIDGPVTIRGETGILQFEQSFKNGVPDGWFRQYDAQGNVKSETLYVEGRAAENPKWTEQKPEPRKDSVTEPESESILTAKTQSLARGERFSFYSNNKYVGRVHLDKDFNIVGKDGKLPDGTVRAYSKDGKLEKEFVFEKDEVKILRVYQPGGALKAEYGYREDKAVKK